MALFIVAWMMSAGPAGEGSRIDLMENRQGLFSFPAVPTLRLRGRRLLAVRLAELSRMPNSIVVEGHTGALPFRTASRSGL
jgi:chemotaxis protein MotB